MSEKWLLPKRIDLRTKIISLILLTGIPLIIVLSMQSVALHHEKISNISEASTMWAMEIAGRPKDIIPDPSIHLLNLSHLPGMATPERCDVLRDIFDPLLKAQPYFTTILVAGPDGKRICPESRDGENTNLFDREYFQRLLQSKTYSISDLLTGRLSGRQSIIFAQPILDQGGNVKYVLSLGLDTKWLAETLNETVSKMNLPGGAIAVVVDSAGTMVAAAPFDYGPVGSQIRDWPIIQPKLATSRHLTREEVWRDGMRRATAYVPIFESPNGSLWMRVGVPIDPALKEVEKDNTRRVILITSVILIALALAWYIGERLVLKPVREIWSAANALRLGDFAARVGNMKATGELGELAFAFDSMANQIQQDRQRLHALAMHDPLTGLPNRNAIREYLTKIIQESTISGGGVGVILLDLNGFKEINDSLGHPLGDKVLVQVAQVLSAPLDERVLSGRLGGDEFVIVVEGAQNPGAFEKLAGTLRERIRRPIIIGEQQFFLSASMGIAIYPGHGNDMDTLLQNADVAMYCAKAEKVPGYCVYMPAMNESAPARLRMQNLMSQAVARGELLLYYQPKIAASSGKVTGAEALVRWKSSELGLVSPADFIPLAEQTGLIVEIGEWVLKTACAQLKIWREDVPEEFSMAVNLSNRQFADPELLTKISGVLDRTGVAANRLELEITEGALMHNPAEAIGVLNQLRSLGMKVSVDDFGTGYSSLGYLKHLPIDALKIDKSFVAGLPDDARDHTIVKAIIAIAKELGLRVTAEGVELEQQVSVLQTLGCDEFQGYFFNRPLPAADFLAMLREQGAGLMPELHPAR